MKMDINVEHTSQDRIKLIKGQRGAYGWEISVDFVTGANGIRRLKEINDALRKEFPTELKNGGE